MILEDDFSRICESRTDCSKLYEDFGTVLAVFHHALYRFQMTDGSGQAIDNGPCLCMFVGVVMFMSYLLLMGMYGRIILCMTQ